MTAESAMWSRLLPSVAPADEADWEALYADQMPRVYNYFRYRVGTGAEAEDLTATTFEKAWRGRHRYRRDLGAFTTWLYSIARNVGIDYFRKRRDALPWDAVAEPAGGESPEERSAKRADLAHLSRLLQELSAREREILALKYGAELTNRAIARLLRLSESNVGTILHRTVRQLRRSWPR